MDKAGLAALQAYEALPPGDLPPQSFMDAAVCARSDTDAKSLSEAFIAVPDREGYSNVTMYSSASGWKLICTMKLIFIIPQFMFKKCSYSE